MATQTTNLGLTKPGYDEAADIVPAVNNNMDAIDAAMGAVPANTSVQAQITANAQAIAKLDESIAIVSNGNTHAAIAAGQYVYIKGHGTLAEGLYTANSAISANATLSNSNVTAVSGGGLNALNSNIANLFAYKEYTINHGSIVAYGAKVGQATITVSGYTPYAIRSYSNSDDHMILYECSMSANVLFYRVKNYDSSAISNATTTIRVAYVKSPATVTELT